MSAAASEITGQRVVRVYYGTSALFTLGSSIIWGINTLFLLDAGLDIFQVMVVNATFSLGQIIFEVPTGVLADTIGRRASILIGMVSLFVSTLLYVAAWAYDWGLAGFIVASVILGFGWTCQTGATDAWLVDALDYTAYPVRKDQIFARGGMVMGVSMLVGTLGGGFLGQANLGLPYLVRAGLIAATFFIVLVFMRDVGFKPRALRLECLTDETRKIFDAGVKYGWRHPVVRPLLFVSLVDGLLLWYLFYASQPYVLEVLGREDLIWVAAAVTALFGLAGVVGNAFVGPLSRTRFKDRPAVVLAASTAGMAVCAIAMGVTGLVAPDGGSTAGFVAIVALMSAFGILSGLVMPIRQAFINDYIPSAQRATVLSLDSLFGEVGGVAGQLGLGYLARVTSKALSYAVGGVFYFIAVPLYVRAGRKAADIPAGQGAATAESDSPGDAVSEDSEEASED
jgi:MFS family permease